MVKERESNFFFHTTEGDEHEWSVTYTGWSPPLPRKGDLVELHVDNKPRLWEVTSATLGYEATGGYEDDSGKFVLTPEEYFSACIHVKPANVKDPCRPTPA